VRDLQPCLGAPHSAIVLGFCGQQIQGAVQRDVSLSVINIIIFQVHDPHAMHTHTSHICLDALDTKMTEAAFLLGVQQPLGTIHPDARPYEQKFW
jgi:hypothetical protein